MNKRHTAAAAALACLLTLAACGDKEQPGVATAGGAKAAASASAQPVDDAERGRRFAQCMRDHGIDMPDPEPGQPPRGEIPKTGANGEKLDDALTACKQFLPGGGEAIKLDPQQVEQLRALSQCMRDNGVENFPEPDDTGSLRIDGNLAQLRNDPKFQAAFEKCRNLMPKGVGGGK
ncbi:hypothetical protein [Catellatospora tritici]|uniref:hypothetical protein n=1 Tax=Catellatospora tritici TaxID=2851566 RepID=UPI001C2D1276|nr:hypothetical protein [Catellatospora tritici]MBV1852089.1 hypothetical protein [Catellatospora tritici]